jgi:hemerythrin-like domain-containing protein
MTGATRPGWALRRLIELHDGMRDDLTVLRQLVAGIATGSPDRAIFDRLSFRQPGWALRRYCTGFCAFVHEHHATEDSVLFPMLLQGQDGRLHEVIDKLRGDHRTLAGLLDRAEQAVISLPDDPAARSTASAAVERLADHLQSHLAHEERALASALNAVSMVVSEDDVPPPPPDHRAYRAELDSVGRSGS